MISFHNINHTRGATARFPTNLALRLFMSTLLMGFILIGIQTGAKAEWVDKIIEASLDAEYNDNVNNSYFDDVKKADYLLLPAVSVGRVYQVDDFTRFSLTGDLKGEFFKDIYRLNSGYLGTTLGLSRKLGIGPYKPWVKIHGSGGYLTVNDRIRDSWLFETGITLGKRLLERLEAEIGYRYDFRDGEDGITVVPDIASNVFDHDGHTGFVRLNYLLLNELQLSLGYAIRDGDVASTCNAEVAAKVIDKVDAVSLDDAYHNVFDERPICTYRMRALTQNITLGAVYAISHHFSASLRYAYSQGSAFDWDYDVNQVNLSLNYSF